ncbi:uncharacterized protein BT62DRAFT_642412 [Guyanagaster necrorhizus]|uniref:DUF6699 domain-containing protein n=1 Tax=Guyanagaster necrorhizus TaxID=856835 RepID=A0A9P8ALW5_9AGAR|nr:uncharacterized protein BT62DRAFT_642412 [Guyanagaster necrorhizus MCA 3950]KAG7440061.1 hypothetical protein BT62DRAFT_642412 [Guyanagaster necrorhizus MCA 3950]
MVSGKRVHWDDSIADKRADGDGAKKFLSSRPTAILSSTDATPLRRVPIPSTTSFIHPSPISSQQQQPILSQFPAANSTIAAVTPPTRNVLAPSIPAYDRAPPALLQHGTSSYNRTHPSSANNPSSHRQRANSLPVVYHTGPAPPHPHTLPFSITTLSRPQIPPMAPHPFSNYPYQLPPQKSLLALAPSSPYNNAPPNSLKQTSHSPRRLSIHRSLRLGTCEPVDFFAPQRVRHACASEPACQPPLPRLFVLVDTGVVRFNIEVLHQYQDQGLGSVTVDDVLARVRKVLRERLDPQTLGGPYECVEGRRSSSFTTVCVGFTVREDKGQEKWKMHLSRVDAFTR